MARMLTVAVAIGLLFLLGAILVTIASPESSAAVPMLVVAAVLLVGVVFAIFGSAWRTKGWSIRHPGGDPR